MKDLKNIKHQIMTDEKVANAVEYLLSKVVLNQRLPQLRFFYKKHKIVLGKNGLYTVYKPNGEKLANKIHFQEVAKYIINNASSIGKIDHIQNIESEMFRHKDKITFFLNYNEHLHSDTLNSKLQSMYDYYYRCKNSLIQILKASSLY